MRSLAVFAAASLVACGGGLSETADARALTAPRATIVLVHGMGGFRQIEGLDYFWDVPRLYRSLGATVVVPGTTTFASSGQRAAELKAQLDQVPGPLLLLCHSQGGLDARLLVSKLGYQDRVKAVVTIATPHHGSPVADLALGLIQGPVEQAVDVLIGQLGWTLEGAHEVTVDSMEHHFNPSVPDMPGVAYWSFSGRAAPLGIGAQNGWLHAPLTATWTFLDATSGANDGIVPEKSAHWGTFLGSIPADHLGEVGQPLGFTPRFDERAFYTRLLHRFRDQGW